MQCRFDYFLLCWSDELQRKSVCLLSLEHVHWKQGLVFFWHCDIYIPHFLSFFKPSSGLANRLGEYFLKKNQFSKSSRKIEFGITEHLKDESFAFQFFSGLIWKKIGLSRLASFAKLRLASVTLANCKWYRIGSSATMCPMPSKLASTVH